jgi:hypothetical protein
LRIKTPLTPEGGLTIKKNNVMKIYFKKILSDKNLKGNIKGFIRKGRLYVAPEIMTLLEDDDVQDIVMRQLEIVDEFFAGKEVAVYDGKALMGKAVVLEYPVYGAQGFVMVRFCDRRVMETDFVCRVERLRIED